VALTDKNSITFVNSFIAKNDSILAKTKEKNKGTETPLMKQYNKIKAKHPDAILLFRVGDFYETFGEDAVKAAEILGIVLTKRKNGSASHIELAGFPHHAMDSYLPKLVRAGHRVAICDQLEDPKMTKKIVKRGITELVTPGVSYNDKILHHTENNFLAAVHLTDEFSGIAFLDISTGEFMCAQGNVDYIDKLLQSLSPNEVLVQRNKITQFEQEFGKSYHTYHLEDWVFTSEFGNDSLLEHFKTKSLKGFGIENLEKGIIAAGACLQYLKETQHHQVSHINTIHRIEQDKYVWLDKFTIRNLELFYSPNEGAKTLFNILDRTESPMGSRLLKRWLALPLKEKKVIDERLNAVEYFTKNTEDKEDIWSQISSVGDLERLISKAAVNRVSPRDVIQLKKALLTIPPIKEKLLNVKTESLKSIGDQLHPCENIRQKIEEQIQDDPPLNVAKGNVIKDGVNEELDELRKLAFSSRDYLEQMQKREVEKTGISSLKVGFNNVFGYYFEVRNTFKSKVPEEWIRKQTLVNAERYITEELKEYESKILGAEEKIQHLETRLFSELVQSLQEYVGQIQQDAQLIAKLDCLLAFADLAMRNDYVKPVLNETLKIDIEEGRHPVIEQQLPLGEEYISNTVRLDNDQNQIMMITGPNMSGKSAILRQTALISLMAQIGCFVPAKKVTLGLVDKIFTRVGASDNISMGESTFMVEMNETASILNNLSERSLILLDEIGRGTSTYDGVSIAWAIAEYIHESPFKPKTLFATHYHELNEMANTFERIKNFNVAIKEVDKKIIFIRKLVPGGSNHSFGIHVADMAGMPPEVISKASLILKKLEDSGETETGKEQLQQAQNDSDYQLSFFQLDDPTLLQIKDQIMKTEIDTLTPVEALMKLNEIKKLIGGK
jgi:DNA mismatch repair protein MutS